MSQKSKKAVLFGAGVVTIIALSFSFKLISFTPKPAATKQHIGCTPHRHVCVMKHIFNLNDKPVHFKNMNELELSAEVKTAVQAGLNWMQPHY